MGEILKMNTIHDYHEFLGVKTLHPLVSVIDLSKCLRFVWLVKILVFTRSF